MPGNMGGAGLNSNVISSVRSGGLGGGSGGVFGAPGAVYGMSKDKDNVKTSLDQIFGKIGSGDFVRNQGIARASGGGGIYGAGYAPVNISAEEQKKFKDMVSEIVGGVAVSNLQVAQPAQPVQQPVQAVQPVQAAQPLRAKGPEIHGIGEQKVNSNQISQVYRDAIEQLKSLQQQEQIIQQRINLLSTLVENFESETNSREHVQIYLILSSIVIIIIFVLFTKMKIHHA
jgi:hypothetical protein